MAITLMVCRKNAPPYNSGQNATLTDSEKDYWGHAVDSAKWL